MAIQNAVHSTIVSNSIYVTATATMVIYNSRHTICEWFIQIAKCLTLGQYDLVAVSISHNPPDISLSDKRFGACLVSLCMFARLLSPVSIYIYACENERRVTSIEYSVCEIRSPFFMTSIPSPKSKANRFYLWILRVYLFVQFHCSHHLRWAMFYAPALTFPYVHTHTQIVQKVWSNKFADSCHIQHANDFRLKHITNTRETHEHRSNN